jgi:hypothetical protein
MRGLVVIALAACTETVAVSDGVHLSTEGLYDDIAAGAVTERAIEYAPVHALWADGAEKRRWLVLPPGGELDTTSPDEWQLPVGAKLFKEFRVGGRRVETRMLERVSETAYRFEPYVWLADDSDAVVVPEGATDVLGTQHDVPPRVDCAICHDSAAGKLLGLSAVQHAGELPLSRPVPRVEVPEALGVLHANCGHCHTATGVASFMQLRLSASDATQSAVLDSIVGVPTEIFGGAELRVAPGDPDASAIVMRMSSRAPGVQMPPIATERTYDDGIALVRAWISSL